MLLLCPQYNQIIEKITLESVLGMRGCVFGATHV
jgi:hypothetical protein